MFFGFFISLIVLFSFLLLVIVLSFRLRFADSDYSFGIFLRISCMKSVSYEYMNKSVRRGAQLEPMECRMCWKNKSTKHNKYIVKQKLEHCDDISFGIFMVESEWVFFLTK